MMASPFTMLGILGKSRRATTAAHPVHATSRITQDALRAPRKSNDSFGSDSNESSSSSRIIGDNTVLVEEPSYTIVPKTENRTDIDQEWTDVGVDGRVKTRPSKAEEERMAREAREGEEERKREEVERQKREEEERRRADERRNEDRKRAEEERRRGEERRNEDRKRAEEERRREEDRRKREEEEDRRKREEEERKRREEEERKAREEEERKRIEEDERRRKEEKRKREENERRMRENYESAARIREERAREAERARQENIRTHEREKLEQHIRHQDEKEKTLQERLTVLENEQQAGAMQVRELMNHSEYLEDQNSLLKTQLQRQSDEVKDLKSQVYDSPNHVKRFLSHGVAKTGKSVEQELVTLLDILNSEVYQAAACLADLLESRGQSRSRAIATTRAAAEEARVVKMLGKEMTEVLKVKTSTAADLDPLIVQVALQMCMNFCCAKITQSWCPGMWNYSDFLSTLFTSIQATEDLTNANKWRSVTHAQFRQNENTKTSMAQYMSEHIMSLLSFIGLPPNSTEWVTELLEERCPMIVGPALHINNSIFEDATGESLEVVLVKAGEIFDIRTMENSYSDSDDDLYAGSVAATTDLGLTRLSPVRKGDTSIIKPKVILASAFDPETRRILEQAL